MFNVYKKTPSISSQPSSIVSCRFGSTEDLYCDDELQCIENDPKNIEKGVRSICKTFKIEAWKHENQGPENSRAALEAS